MKKKLLGFMSLILAVLSIISCATVFSFAENTSYPSLGLDCKSAVLMEAKTGTILYAQNENEALPPASVTKIMTLLLVMEAIEDKKINYTDMVSASEHACSMGGSQIYLEPGERMSVEDLLKSVIIASANDAAVTLAEYVAGTEEAFVQMMNEKAAELGMKNTNFENTNGLDDTTTEHVTSALDIAIMSRALIRYPKITEYSSIWMDTVRNGEFGLTNTNRLIRYYEGATGLKTGSTSKAGFCISATATRDGMTLIAVIMGSPDRDTRNSAAVSLLNYGFTNFSLYSNQPYSGSIPVVKGKKQECAVREESFCAVVEKKYFDKITPKIDSAPSLSAPVKLGTQVGTVTYEANGKTIGTSRIVTCEEVKTVTFVDIILRLLSRVCFC